MSLFATLTAPAAPILCDNLNTDVIVGAGSRSELVRALARQIHESAGEPGPDSPFAQPPFTLAAILIVGRFFGDGVHAGAAAAALKKRGVACILGLSFTPSFAEAAHDAGVIALTIDKGAALRLAEEAMTGDAITVDMKAMSVITRHGERHVLTPPPETRWRFAAAQAEASLGRRTGDEEELAHLIYAVTPA